MTESLNSPLNRVASVVTRMHVEVSKWDTTPQGNLWSYIDAMDFHQFWDIQHNRLTASAAMTSAIVWDGLPR